MKKILLALFLATSIATPTIAAEQPPDYCDESWQQWQQLLAEKPQDDCVAVLYALRIGLFMRHGPLRHNWTGH